ncbi:MAG: RNA polymerase sigma factor [Microcystis aeruginosa BK11-02]|nr:RNA polymerase sigma factor [Microcystis aeruginosa BK11-02]
MLLTLNNIKKNYQKNNQFVREETNLLKRLIRGEQKAFWSLWLPHQDYLYFRCITWMGGNCKDGEEALSRAIIKAYEKMPIHAEKITNPKAWLTRMTHNLCVDIHRERQRQVSNVEDIRTLAN